MAVETNPPADGTAALDPESCATQDGLRAFAPGRQAAFLGLLRAHAELTRTLDGELAREHGLSLSVYELLSRLAHAERQSLRMSDVAQQTGLSLSRVSRLIDQLQARGLVVRMPCDYDSRVVHAALTPQGAECLRRAQDTFFEIVEERFLGRLDCDEVETLGALLARLHEQGSAAR